MTSFLPRLAWIGAFALVSAACTSEQPHCAGATSIPPVVGAADSVTGEAICNVSFTWLESSDGGMRSLDDGGVRTCDAIPQSAACTEPVPDGGGRCDFALTGVMGTLGGTQYAVSVSAPGYQSQTVMVVAGVQSLCGEVLQNSSRIVVRLTPHS